MDDIDRWIFEDRYRNAIGRVIRDSSVLDSLDDEQFRLRFRLTRSSFYFVCSRIENCLEFPDGRCGSIPPATCLAIALQSLATGNFQITEGDLFSLSQPTVSRCFNAVLKAIAHRKSEFIKWPTPEQEESIKNKFYELTGIPQVIGCIDGTFVKVSPPRRVEYAYVTRKGFKAINVGLACDVNRRFFWVSAKYPGRAHDSRVFRESSLYRVLRSGSRHGVLLGDSAYRSETFLLKPILSPRNYAEERFTNGLCRGRVTIENAIGILKRQWPALQGKLRLTPEKCSLAILAAVAMRNVANEYNEPDFTDTEYQQEPTDNEDIENGDILEVDNAVAFKDHIISSYFV
ncbi:transposase, IS4 family [Oesophagostomum dentatum]|uniref:Putative nuclease HARBI1 n=1 Tax=Oesophagostomum dentatum TaxID=61180 RepID=A0A0B1S178_OESDE|nr:transposase, IS4 family [Oesophagostomum dentatum]